MTDYKLLEKIGELTEKIKEASEASGKLAKALNKLTLIGVLVALGVLIFEIFKYFNGGN